MADQAHQHDDADGGEDVERAAGDQQCLEHADKRHRQGHHDGDGLQEGAELRGQHQIDQNHRKQQCLACMGRALGYVLGRAAEDEAVARRQFGLGENPLREWALFEVGPLQGACT